MNKAVSLLILVKSLSKAEKRYFRLYSNVQSGQKVYLYLFDLLEKHTSIDEIYNLFSERYGINSFEIASKHLYKVLFDALIHLRTKWDIQTRVFNSISKAGILFERGLLKEALNELAKAKKLSITYENDSLILLIRRTELKYLSSYDFNGMTEKQLIDKQMKINEVMKYTRSINLHNQLYDILKHRFIYKEYTRSDKQKNDQNDLVLSELNLISNSSYKGFETEKLHLLFQSMYFLNSGNYKSALRFYRQLITLFDENRHMILNPPIDYYNALLGILDSLQSAGVYHEMPFFISKLKEVAKGNYSTEYVLTLQTHIYLYEFACLLNTGRLDSLIELRFEYDESIFKRLPSLPLNLQLNLLVNETVLYLSYNRLHEARRSMQKILGAGKALYNFPAYRIARLINLLIQAEQNKYDYIEMEIKSIKRHIRFEKSQYATEKLLFKFLLTQPLPTCPNYRSKLWAQYKKEIQIIKNNKYERPLLKVFNFLAWIESKFTNQSLYEMLNKCVTTEICVNDNRARDLVDSN